MKSRINSIKFDFKKAARPRLTAGLLLCVLLTAPAEAFLFFGKKKPTAPASVAPVSAPQLAPGIQPNNSQPADNGAAPAPGQTIAPIPTIAAPPDPVASLVEQGIFPPDAATRDTPVTRGELAMVLVKALEHNTSLYSEFPFFRDVPRDHPDYVFIEVAREKHLITQAEHGFYEPDRPITYGEVYRALARATTGQAPSQEETEHLLEAFADRDELPPDVAPAIARMVRSRAFWRDPNTGRPVWRRRPGSISLNWNDEVTPAGLAPLIESLQYLTMHRAQLLPEVSEIPSLPARIELSLTPSSSIFETQLTVGEAVYFSLVSSQFIAQPLEGSEPLPKGMRFRGVVQEVQPNRTYVIHLMGGRTPEDVIYRTNATVMIVFPPKERLNFIVPGEILKAVTFAPEPLPSEPAEATAPPPSDETATPPLVPPAVQQKAK